MPAEPVDVAASNGEVEQATRLYHGGPDKRQWGPRTIAYGQAVRATYRHMKSRTLSAKAS
jgi:hypothetical protein